MTWPGVVAPGTTCSEPIIGVDLYPTLLAMTGAKAPRGQPLDGENLLPLFTGKKEALSRDAIFWHFPAYLQSYNRYNEQRDPLFRARPCSVVRSGDWKLHHLFENNSCELYNLRSDIGETKNLASAHPERVTVLRALLDAWRNDINAPIPTTPNPDYDAAAEQQAIARALAPKKLKSR